MRRRQKSLLAERRFWVYFFGDHESQVYEKEPIGVLWARTRHEARLMAKECCSAGSDIYDGGTWIGKV